MEGLLKHKQHPRRKKRSDRVQPTGDEQGDIADKYSNPNANVHMNSNEQNVDGHSSPEIEIPNCSQFIEHEPSVIWGSPQGSPNNNEEKYGKVVNLITPPQLQRNARKKPVTLKRPVRKLKPEAVSPSFLTDLWAFSEQCKHNEEPTAVPEKCVFERNRQSSDDFENRKAHTDSPNQETLKKPTLALSSTPIRDDYDMLLADDDDDVIIKCTQQIEETINETESDNSDQSSSKLISHQEGRKSKQLHVNEWKPSNRSNVRTPKPVKSSNAKNNGIVAEKSPLPKFKVRTPNSAKYYKSGVFLGYGSRKSPRIKKNILETSVSGTQQEVYNDSFESALQTFVDDDCGFLDTSVTNEYPGRVDLCNKSTDKRHHSLCTISSAEQTANSKVKIRQNELRNMPPEQPKPIKYEQTVPKSKAGNSRKLCNVSSVALLSEKTITFEDDLENETELVNVLDIVESQAAPSSPPLRCTPEEIQRKRIEAKQKLAKKKLTANKKTSGPTIVKPKR